MFDTLWYFGCLTVDNGSRILERFCRQSQRISGSCLSLAILLISTASNSAWGQIVITDINPDQSTLDAMDPDGASGGRVNGLANVPGDPDTYYAASEWGGLYKTSDFQNAGGQWFRLEDHVPMVTWDVGVNPEDTARVYATSFYDVA